MAARPSAAQALPPADTVSYDMPSSAANGALANRIAPSATVAPEAYAPSTAKDESPDGNKGSPVNSRQDPFGLVPADWPVDIKLHPAALVAKSGVDQIKGRYLVTLIPSDQATVPGAQAFYLEMFSTWPSLQVEVDPNGDKTALTIVAERPGAKVTVNTRVGTSAFMAALPNKDYWLHRLGVSPVVIQLFYRTTP